MPKPRLCDCGECSLCKGRAAANRRYAAMSVDERRRLRSKVDPEKRRLWSRNHYDQSPEAKKEAARRWREENAARALENKRAWIKRFPEKRSAYNAVQAALRSGRLVRPDSCESCGANEKPHAHHDDYAKKLEVRWLCKDCHGAIHRLPRSVAS